VKLAAKLVVFIIAAIILDSAVAGYLSVRREVELFDVDMRSDAHLLGDAVGRMVADVWNTNGPDRALELIDEVNSREYAVGMRWVWFDAPPGDPFAPRAPHEQLTALPAQDAVSVVLSDPPGPDRLFTYVVVHTGKHRSEEKRVGGLELSESLAPARDYSRSTIIRTVVATAILVGLSISVVALLGLTWVGQPLRQLTDKAQRVGRGDLSGPLTLRGNDELTQLAQNMNTMCAELARAQEKVRQETEARIAALEQPRHADRLKTVGRLASGVAHELGTPLNVVSGRAALIARGDLSPDEVTDSARIIRGESERMATLIRQLLDFARRRSPKKQPTDLARLAEQTVSLLKPLAQKQNATLELHAATPPVVAPADAGQVQQVLSNILMNALQAMTPGGKVNIDIDRATAARPANGAPTPCARIAVQDEGHGITPEHLPHVFEPFFTTKDVGEGTGLGLSISYGIIQEHGGWIDVSSAPSRGSRFSIYLPLEAAPCPDESSSSTTTRP